MKRILYLLMLLLPGLTYSQVHIKNQRYLQINVGTYDNYIPSLDNFHVHAEIAKYNRKLHSRGFGFMYAKKLSGNDIPVEKLQLSYKQEINLFSSANLTSTFKVLGTANFGYESINRDQQYFGDNYISTKSAFIFGLGAGAEYEFTPLVIGVRTTYNFLSQYQKFSLYPYLGVKIHFW